MSRCHVRCRDCGARRVLSMHPDWYVRPPACRTCGGKRYRPDAWMNKRNTSPYHGGDGCNCGAYHFPHRRGSGSCWRGDDYFY